jgi:cell division protein FtsN
VWGTLVSTAPKTPVRESSEPLTAKPVTGAKDSVGQPTIPAKKQVQVPPKPPTTSSTSKAGGEYSVQLAAYNHKPDAEKLAASLVKRGYQARVDGDIVPFRVRIGRYSTEREAEDALKKIKAKHMDGFIARAPQR